VEYPTEEALVTGRDNGILVSSGLSDGVDIDRSLWWKRIGEKNNRIFFTGLQVRKKRKSAGFSLYSE